MKEEGAGDAYGQKEQREKSWAQWREAAREEVFSAERRGECESERSACPEMT